MSTSDSTGFLFTSSCFNSSIRYQFDATELLNFDDAVNACASLGNGAALARIDTSAENTFVINMLSTMSSTAVTGYYIGVKDPAISSSAAATSTARFKYIDGLGGESFFNTGQGNAPWKSGQPGDRATKEGCVAIKRNDASTGTVWNDFACSDVIGFVCRMPCFAPTLAPTKAPTKKPTNNPTKSPTHKPTFGPTKSPSHHPTKSPTHKPTFAPTKSPSTHPTKSPTDHPTLGPTESPTHSPTHSPTFFPTLSPETIHPTSQPSLAPVFASSSEIPIQGMTAAQFAVLGMLIAVLALALLVVLRITRERKDVKNLQTQIFTRKATLPFDPNLRYDVDYYI